MAYGTILIIPVLLIFIFLQKQIIGGLTATQVSKMSVTALDALSSTQIAAFGSTQLRALTADQIGKQQDGQSHRAVAAGPLGGDGNAHQYTADKQQLQLFL